MDQVQVQVHFIHTYSITISPVIRTPDFESGVRSSTTRVSPTLVNSQLVNLPPVGIFNKFMFHFTPFFHNSSKNTPLPPPKKKIDTYTTSSTSSPRIKFHTSPLSPAGQPYLAYCLAAAVLPLLITVKREITT